jgi:hypothetical protein
VTVVIDEHDHMVYQKRLANELTVILTELSVYQAELQSIAVESPYNWYWLVDGFMEHGYTVHLVNTAAIHQYEGLKYTDDHSDARWLAHLLRLDVLPEGYIYPRADRPMRDLLRKRSQMVRQRTTNLLSIQSWLTRNTGRSLSANRVKELDGQQVGALLPHRDLALAVKANLSVMSSADEQTEILERTILERVKLRSPFKVLKSVPGIGIFSRLPSCWRPATSGGLIAWVTLRRTAAVSAVRRSATVRKKARAIPRTATSRGWHS